MSNNISQASPASQIEGPSHSRLARPSKKSHSTKTYTTCPLSGTSKTKMPISTFNPRKTFLASTQPSSLTSNSRTSASTTHTTASQEATNSRRSRKTRRLATTSPTSTTAPLTSASPWIENHLSLQSAGQATPDSNLTKPSIDPSTSQASSDRSTSCPSRLYKAVTRTCSSKRVATKHSHSLANHQFSTIPPRKKR